MGDWFLIMLGGFFTNGWVAFTLMDKIDSEVYLF